MQRLEVEMDSVIDDADNENMHVFANERQPLARNLGSHGLCLFLLLGTISCKIGHVIQMKNVSKEKEKKGFLTDPISTKKVMRCRGKMRQNV